MADLRTVVNEALMSFACQHTVQDDGDGGMPLLDMLTPKGDETVKRGFEELEQLTDHIIGALMDALEPNGQEFTDWGRAALLWVLWHHQGGSSNVGQPIRFALGMGQHERLSDYQIARAEAWAELTRTAGVSLVDHQVKAPSGTDAPKDDQA